MNYDADILAPALAERYATLIRISQATGIHRDPKELFEALTNELRRIVPFDYVGVSLRHQNSAHFQDHFINVESRSLLPNGNLASEERLTSWAYEHQQPLLTSTDEPDSRYRRAHGILKGYGIRSTCTLPLTTAHRRLGAISFGSKSPHTYAPDEVRFASLVADQIALAFDNALNFLDLQKTSEELQNKNDRLQLLLGLTNQLSPTSSYRTCFDRLLQVCGGYCTAIRWELRFPLVSEADCGCGYWIFPVAKGSSKRG